MSESAQKKEESGKYNRIIAAATKTFAEKGFFKSTVSDVARAAEVAEGTIYLYFKNKDDLLISIFESSMDMFIREMDQALEGITDVKERLRRLITLHLSLVEAHRELAQVLHIELRQSSMFMREYTGDKLKQYLKFIQDIIEAGQAEGVFNSNADPYVLRRTIFGALDEVGLKWVLSKRKGPLEQFSKQIADLFLNGLTQLKEK